MEREHRRWMYDRNYPNRRGLKEEFVVGVKVFINHAKMLPEFLKEGTIRCPCAKCHCTKLLTPDDVKLHLYKKGFRDNYYIWTVHGEDHCTYGDIDGQNFTGGESSTFVENSRVREMMSDAFGVYPGVQSNQNIEESPNEEAKRFYESLEAASRPLYEGSLHSELSVAVRLLTIKSDCNISQAAMDAMIGLMSEISPNINLPGDYNKAKKLASKLGHSSKKIDCCENGCMLYYGDDVALESCKFCGSSRFKEVINAKRGPVSQAEVFEETQMKKLKDGTKTTWIEQRAKTTYNNFKQYVEEFMHNQPKDDQRNPIQPPEKEIKDMWLRVARGVYKGRVYGLGSECSASIGTSRFSGGSSSSQSSVNQDELEQLHRRIAELNELYMQEKAAREEEERRRKEEMKKKDDEFKRVTNDVQSLKAQLLMLSSSSQLPNLPHSPPNSDNEQ